ncbi:MAG: 2-phospho-L-lactate guanylyltransferase [Pseudomonadota bacterium]
MTGDAPKTDMPERDLVAIALRDPAGGKTRLRDTLSGRQTEALSWALFDRLIVELSAARPACVDLAVISGQEVVQERARQAGLAVISDATTGLSDAAEAARDWATERRYRSMTILPSDLADPDQRDLSLLMRVPCPANQVLLVPSQDLGTNGLRMTLPGGRFGFRYGPRSYTKHLGTAEEAGLTPITLQLPSLRRDIDRPEDLTDLPLPIRAALDAAAEQDTGQNTGQQEDTAEPHPDTTADPSRKGPHGSDRAYPKSA